MKRPPLFKNSVIGGLSRPRRSKKKRRFPCLSVQIEGALEVLLSSDIWVSFVGQPVSLPALLRAQVIL